MLSSIIQVIFFDLGDTLVRIKLEILQDICRTIGRIRGQPLEIHEYMDAFRAQWSNRDIKDVTTHSQELVYWQGFFEDLFKSLHLVHSYRFLIEQFANIYSDPNSFECFEDVHTVLPELKSRYRLGLIANAFPSAVRIIHDLNLRNYFEYKYTFLSFDIPDGYVKPEPEIYRFASKKAGVDIGYTLFVDDRWPFVKAALDVGMKAYLIERFSEENKQLITKSFVPRIYDLYELSDKILEETNEKKTTSLFTDVNKGSKDSPSRSTKMHARSFAAT